MSNKKTLSPAEAGSLTGRECTIRFGCEKTGYCVVNFKIVGVGKNFGRNDLSVTPISGGGKMQKSLDSVSLLGTSRAA